MRRVFGVAVVALIICIAGPAYAQSDAEKQLAKKHYELGEQFYKISNYPRALTEFSSAYKLYALPGLLFNIARCHEVMANLDQALRYYKMYLKKLPASPKRSLVEVRIKTLQARLDARKPKPPPPAKPGVTAPVPGPVSAPKPVPAPAPAEPSAPDPFLRLWSQHPMWTGLPHRGAGRRPPAGPRWAWAAPP